MIRAAGPEDGAQLLRALRASPALGALLEADWLLKNDNPAMPWLFYLAGDAAVLKLDGGHAVLCGTVYDGEELASFLHLHGVTGLESDGLQPPGWHAEPLAVLARQSAAGAKGPAGPPGLDMAPPPGEVLAVLESSRPFAPPARRERYYAALCARLNRGLAAVYGVREGGLLASVAQATVTDAGVCISAVETRPAFQGRGHASALVGCICSRYAPKPASLVCRPALAGFYRRLGFGQLPQNAVWARRPDFWP